MSGKKESLLKGVSSKIADIAVKSVDASPEVYSYFIFGHEIALDEELELVGDDKEVVIKKNR